MNLFDIKANLYELLENGFTADCIDPETGEFDAAKAEALMVSLPAEFAEKVENTALYIEELDARADALKAKEQELAKRRKAFENRAEWLRGYLTAALDKPFESDAVKITFRKSASVECDVSKLPAEYVKVKTTCEADKTALKAALTSGAIISGATLVEKRNIKIV